MMQMKKSQNQAHVGLLSEQNVLVLLVKEILHDLGSTFQKEILVLNKNQFRKSGYILDLVHIRFE